MAKGKRYVAIFHPQVWMQDSAMEVEALGEQRWDVTAFLEQQPSIEGALEADTYESDALTRDPAAPAWIQDWALHSPFYVEVEEVKGDDR